VILCVCLEYLHVELIKFSPCTLLGTDYYTNARVCVLCLASCSTTPLLSLSLSPLPIPFTSITNAFIHSRPINKVRALHSFSFCASSPLQDLLILPLFFPTMLFENGYLYSFTAHLIYFYATVSAFLTGGKCFLYILICPCGKIVLDTHGN